jgi:LacI family transcriptional regulator
MNPTDSSHNARRERPVTQQEVADRAGVSRAVVSYVINNGPRFVTEETRQRVLQAIEALGYRPNKFAQGLKLRPGDQARGQIGIIMGGNSEILRRPYFAALLAGIYREAQRVQRQIRFVTFLEELLDPVFFNKNLHPEEISGLIMFAPYLALQDPRALDLITRVRARIDNIVSLETRVADLPTVFFDRAAAACQAVEHLIRLGHSRIAFSGAPDERLDGCRQALLAHGLPFDPALTQPLGLHNLPEEGYQSVEALFRLPQPPTALFTASDDVAIGALAALHDHGLRCPDDLAIVSIDDTELAALVRPALTTIHVPKESIGIHALRILDTYAAYPDSPPASVVLPTELIVRQSCGSRRA